MSKAGKATEPSMEEILSSIRKIIAEEPVVATPAAAVPQKAAVDDILELADAASRAETANGADAGKASGVPSWLFPATKSSAPAGAGNERAPDEPAPKSKVVPEATREVPKPFFRAAEAKPEPAAPTVALAARIGTNGFHLRNPGDAKASEDLGTVVPRRNAEQAPSPVSGVTERRTPQAGLPEWLSRASGAVAKTVAAPQPIAAPTEPTRIAPREADAVMPVLAELARPVAEIPPAEPMPAVADVVAAPEAAIAAAESMLDSAMAEAPAPAEQPVAEIETTAGGLAMAETAAHGAVPKPTLLSERSRTQKVNAAAEVTPAVTPAGAVRTLDDTIIDLLRPMIRQWLDDNMPRMVEKALRVELAAGVKSKSDQSKH